MTIIPDGRPFPLIVRRILGTRMRVYRNELCGSSGPKATRWPVGARVVEVRITVATEDQRSLYAAHRYTKRRNKYQIQAEASRLKYARKCPKFEETESHPEALALVAKVDRMLDMGQARTAVTV